MVRNNHACASSNDKQSSNRKAFSRNKGGRPSDNTCESRNKRSYSSDIAENSRTNQYQSRYDLNIKHRIPCVRSTCPANAHSLSPDFCTDKANIFTNLDNLPFDFHKNLTFFPADSRILSL